ncbi:hypothetical protein B0H11DRAFT_1934699 [Mycena galericulata]|nr:hypothetical protein B0H11DRAFT_1934699 [Mycena galericulata]
MIWWRIESGFGIAVLGVGIECPVFGFGLTGIECPNSCVWLRNRVPLECPVFGFPIDLFGFGIELSISAVAVLESRAGSKFPLAGVHSNNLNPGCDILARGDHDLLDECVDEEYDKQESDGLSYIGHERKIMNELRVRVSVYERLPLSQISHFSHISLLSSTVTQEDYTKGEERRTKEARSRSSCNNKPNADRTRDRRVSSDSHQQRR